MEEGEKNKNKKEGSDHNDFDQEINLSGSKTKKIFTTAVIAIFFAVLMGFFSWNLNKKIKNSTEAEKENNTIKVGILHSLSGSMAVTDSSIVDATLFAIEQINSQGGILGKKIEPIIVDGESDMDKMAREAERLITEEGVSVLFGCSTSACYRTLEPVLHKYNKLLFYSNQCEGLRHSHNIIVTGPLLNQQLAPTIEWALSNLGDTFYLVGTDYVYSRTANEMAKEIIREKKGRVTGEDYVLLGDNDFADIIDEISSTQPKVVLSSIIGDSNQAFFREMAKAGITPDKIPVISLSVSEDEIRIFGNENIVGDYAVRSYFQSIDSEANKEFLKKFKKKFGSHRVVNDPMESAYVAVNFWAQAARKANSFAPEKIHDSLSGQFFEAPEGAVYIDEVNHHAWKKARIGKIKSDGILEVVWGSEGQIHPSPYPGYKTDQEWDAFIYELYKNWNEKWINPGVKIEDIKDEISQAQELIKILSLQPSLLAAAESSNGANKDMSEEEIAALDSNWRNVRGQSDLADQLLANEAAQTLKKFQNEYSQFAELSLTDKKGLNIAITNLTRDYYHGGKDWWVKTYNSGYGKSFYGKIGYEENSQVFGIAIYQPVYNKEEQVIGIIKAVIDLKQINFKK